MFRPAKLRRRQRWSLRGDRLTGPGGSVALRSVQHLTLVQMRSGGMRMMRVDLETGSQIARLQITTSARRRREDPDHAAFLALLSEVSERLAEVRPGLTYRMEETGRARLAFFLIGAAALLVGMALTLLLGVAFQHQPRFFLMALPGLLAIKVTGAVAAWRFWPFRHPEEYPIATLPFILWTLGGPRPARLPEGQDLPEALGKLG
ncbi:hypothetical protein KUV28_06145 [Ferrimonas balearica]|nr:hypothetical protein [Ferrimonas balearica]